MTRDEFTAIRTMQPHPTPHILLLYEKIENLLDRVEALELENARLKEAMNHVYKAGRFID